MKNIIPLLFLIVSVSWFSCAPPAYLRGQKYVYTHTLIGDNVKENVYEDSLIKITFSITRTEIDFVMFNKTENPIKIIWDEASFIPYQEGKRVIHKGVTYIDRDKSQVPTTVPSKTMWSDLIVPTENITYRAPYQGMLVPNPGGWDTKDMWLLDDLGKPENVELIMKQKGLKYRVLLPMEINGVKKNYTFNFQITDIVSIAKKPPKQGLPF